jgi:hypothetical protein
MTRGGWKRSGSDEGEDPGERSDGEEQQLAKKNQKPKNKGTEKPKTRI